MVVNLPAILPSGIWGGILAGVRSCYRLLASWGAAADNRLCLAGMGLLAAAVQAEAGGAIACVGRMTLTNYLLQTLICTTIFYRFGLFMKFDRLQLLAFVVPVWAVNMTFSLFGYAISVRGRWNGCGVS